MAISVTMASVSSLVKVFRRLYLLNLWMEVVHISYLPNVRYWSEVLYCTILTHLSDLEVIASARTWKKKIMLKFLEAKCDSDELGCLATFSL